MRHGQLIAVTAIALVGMAGCADRPNDLDTYYDDPVRQTENSPRAASSSPRALPLPSATTTTSSPPVEPLGPALLTDADVASEGVAPAGAPSAMEGCLSGLPEGRTTSAGWRYPTGSELHQHVLGLAEGNAATAVEELRCVDTEPLTLGSPEGTTAHRGWCVGSTCTVVLARNEIVSAVQVAAGSADRAAEAAVRLAPAVATALARRVSQR